MAVTKRHIWNLFMRGWSSAKLVAEYKVTQEWVESAIRKYIPRAL